MIVNEATLKKLIKSAWLNNALFWGKIDDRYIVGNGSWFLRINEHRMSQKALAALVEFTGIIPTKGMVFKCSDGTNQIVLPETVTEQFRYIDLLEDERNPIVNKTDIIISAGYGFPTARLYQSKSLRKTIAINEIFTGLIEGKREPGEDLFKADPYLSKMYVYWMTDEACLIVYPILFSNVKKDSPAYDTANLFARLSKINLLDGTDV